MNWIFESYSNVYNTAMMQEQRPARVPAEAAKARATSRFAKLFHRG